jgi:small conductance mechanosensitive channel
VLEAFIASVEGTSELSTPVATVARVLVATVPPDTAPPDTSATDALLTETCGEQPGVVCENVLDATDNETLAKIANWFIDRPLKILLILAVTWAVARVLRRFIRRSIYRVMSVDPDRTLRRVGLPDTTLLTGTRDPRREARASSIAAALASVAAATVWVIGLILVIGELGVDLAPLIAGAGVAGVALGFGAQSLVKDCISGLFMLVEDQFGLGDTVDVGVASGSIERVTLRTTVLRGFDGTVWHVPNGEIRRVGNRSQLWSMAVLDVVIAAENDVEAARRVLGEVAQAVCSSDEFAADVLEAPQETGVEAIGPDGVTLRVHVKTAPGAQFRLQRTLRERVLAAFVDAGIELPGTVGDAHP